MKAENANKKSFEALLLLNETTEFWREKKSQDDFIVNIDLTNIELFHYYKAKLKFKKFGRFVAKMILL